MAFSQLQSSEVGNGIAKDIQEAGTLMKFGLTPGAIAQFDRKANEVTINAGQKEASPAVLAAHLAHEGTHVQWNESDSIDQEYQAFKAQAAVWNQIKGDETDEQCDYVSEMIARGEAEAKAEIRQLYPDLLEHGHK